MDIAALLAESNLEAAAEEGTYDTDEFEDEYADSKGQNDGGPTDAGAVLKAAATKVAVEEKKVADKVFNETAGGIGDEIKQQKAADKNPEAILVSASRTVNEHYNRQDPSEAAKFRAVDEKEDEGEGESDEEDANEEPELNQSLLFAVFNERLEGVKTALRKGANYFYRDRHGWTALHWAASKGFDDIIEALIDHVKSKGRNIAKYVNAQDTLTGWTPLHVSAVFYQACPSCCAVVVLSFVVHVVDCAILLLSNRLRVSVVIWVQWSRYCGTRRARTN
jgi:hypothetical protein